MQEMDIWLHPLFSVWYDYLHIPELHQRFISTIALITYYINFKIYYVSNYLPMPWYPFLDSKVHVAEMGPTWGPVGPRWAPRWSHEPCYPGCFVFVKGPHPLKGGAVCLTVFFGKDDQLHDSFLYFTVMIPFSDVRGGRLYFKLAWFQLSLHHWSYTSLRLMLLVVNTTGNKFYLISSYLISSHLISPHLT